LLDSRDGHAVVDEVVVDFGPFIHASNAPTPTPNSSTIFACHMNIWQSVLDSSPTLLIDTETGERVPHWVEVFAPGDMDASSPLMGEDHICSKGMLVFLYEVKHGVFISYVGVSNVHSVALLYSNLDCSLGRSIVFKS
jgi:hypothetical protein